MFKSEKKQRGEGITTDEKEKNIIKTPRNILEFLLVAETGFEPATPRV